MEEYRWSSYLEYFNDAEIREKDRIVDTEKVLELFLPKKEKIQAIKEFYQFNKKCLKFHESLELLEYEIKNKLTDEEVIYFIKEELGIDNIQEIQKYNIEYRNQIIRKIRKIKGVTRPQIARILGITIKMVERASNLSPKATKRGE